MQTGSRGDGCEREHACGHPHRARALCGAGPAQVAVRCLVQRCHPRQLHGEWRRCWVSTLLHGIDCIFQIVY